MARVTMQDIAEELGLSRFTVARALGGGAGGSEETRNKVLETAQRLGYLGRHRGMANSFRTRNVLFLVEQFRFTGDRYFWPRVLAGVEAATRRRRLNLMVATIEAEQEETGFLPPALRERNVDGVLAVGEFDPVFLHLLRAQSLPVVMVDVDGGEHAFDAVMTADAWGAALAVRHLAALGHRKIGFLGDLSYASSFRRRYEGFVGARRLLGLPEEGSPAITAPTVWHYWDTAEVKAALRRVQELPTAFLCANDSVALTLIVALEEMGFRVPQDVSVVGFDDIDLAGTNRLPLTTIHVFKERMGERAMELLAWRLENPGYPRETIAIETELVVRASSGSHHTGEESGRIPGGHHDVPVKHMASGLPEKNGSRFEDQRPSGG
ncbi:MAG: LacI family transcriptional regulator [Firmicutes bacterium]|nr:LacI family transcriptional regulator [Bacillota bacterium]